MTSVKRLHRTWLFPPDLLKDDNKNIKPEFFDLYMKFMRNRVWMQIDVSDATQEDEERMTHLFESQVINALENRCTGFWTLDYTEDKSGDEVSFYVLFEKEEDLKGFLANEAMMFKLTA